MGEKDMLHRRKDVLTERLNKTVDKESRYALTTKQELELIDTQLSRIVEKEKTNGDRSNH